MNTQATVTSPDADMATIATLGKLALGLVAGASGGDASYGTLKRGFREAMVRDPLDSLAVTVLGGSYLFYMAEKGTNPKCESFFDALVFITTSLSVGYDDVFARTDAGKAIASFVMTFGPALSSAALEPPATEKPESLVVQEAILARLDAILGALKASGVAASAEPAPPAPPR